MRLKVTLFITTLAFLFSTGIAQAPSGSASKSLRPLERSERLERSCRNKQNKKHKCPKKKPPVQRAGSLSVDCPTPAVGNYPQGPEIGFGFHFTPGTTGAAQYLFDYGDGPHFASSSWEEARYVGLSHTYRRPGTYTFHAAVIDGAGLRVDASCVWYWTSPVVPRGGGNGGTSSNGSYRTGATCRDGSHSSATGSGACSWHGGVRYWLYG